MSYKKAYTISYDRETDQWYCHMIGYPNIPVMGSFGSKRKAEQIANAYNLKA